MRRPAAIFIFVASLAVLVLPLRIDQSVRSARSPASAKRAICDVLMRARRSRIFDVVMPALCRSDFFWLLGFPLVQTDAASL